MNDDLKQKTVLVFDYGLFHCVAERLARDFGRVLYYVPWKGAFPKSSTILIGKGFDNVERIPDSDRKKDFWDYIDEVDLFVFPDLLDSDLQEHLRDMGKRVWGSGRADRLETDRLMFRKLQEKLKMPTPKYEVIKGMQALKEFLMDTEDVYVKVSVWRGDIETFHHDNYVISAPYLEDLEYHLGPKKETMEFIVEYPVKGVEIGYDGISIDGKFPEITAYGYEEKGRAYIGKIAKYEDLPEALKTTNEKLSSTFKEMGLRGFYSNEIRIGKDKIPYLVDPCVRCASPPTEVMVEAYSNFSEILWHGAGGQLVVPKPTGKYLALARICSPYAEKDYTTIEYPDSMAKQVKLRNATVCDDGIYIIPYGADTIGSLVGIGQTIDEAIEKVKKNSDKVKAIRVEIYSDAFDKIKETISEGKKYGINF